MTVTYNNKTPEIRQSLIFFAKAKTLAKSGFFSFYGLDLRGFKTSVTSYKVTKLQFSFPGKEQI